MADEKLRASFSLNNGRFCIGDSKIDLTDLPTGTREATLTPGDFGQGESMRLTLAYYRTSSHVSKKVTEAFQEDSRRLSGLSVVERRMRVYPRDSPSPQTIYIFLKGPVNARIIYQE